MQRERRDRGSLAANLTDFQEKDTAGNWLLPKECGNIGT